MDELWKKYLAALNKMWELYINRRLQSEEPQIIISPTDYETVKELSNEQETKSKTQKRTD